MSEYRKFFKHFLLKSAKCFYLFLCKFRKLFCVFFAEIPKFLSLLGQVRLAYADKLLYFSGRNEKSVG